MASQNCISKKLEVKKKKTKVSNSLIMMKGIKSQQLFIDAPTIFYKKVLTNTKTKIKEPKRKFTKAFL